jgi:hypothetical protein
MPQAQRKTDGAPEIVDNERQWFRVESLDELREVVGVSIGGIDEISGPIGQTESDMVGGDASVCGRKRADQVPPFERPGRSSVNEQDRLAAALVHVMHSADGEIHPLARKWIG